MAQVAGYDHKDEILFDFGWLAEEQSATGQVCPACKGGSSQEATLSVTRRDGLLLYNCHRASCSFHGAVSDVGKFGAGQSFNRKRPSYPRIKSHPLDGEAFKLLSEKYGIKREDLEIAGLAWSGDGDGPLARRICFPIYGPGSEERGTSYRSYKENVTPKSIIELRSADDVAAAWYKWRRKSSTLVVVEDQMSAIKLASHTHTLALLGTNLSEAKVGEIIEGKYDRVLLSLDRDAVGEAIKLQLKYRNKIKGLLVASIPVDIKNMNEDQFDDYLLAHIL